VVRRGSIATCPLSSPRAALYRHAVDALAQGGNAVTAGDRVHLGDLTDGGMALDMGGFQQESGDPYRLQVPIKALTFVLTFINLF
jgi:hypothetical protein